MQKVNEMNYVDVIGIGAINYDYMFQCKKKYNHNSSPDSGREDQGRKQIEVEKEIEELHRSGKEFTTQVGGSAYLAIKTIKAIDKTLSTAYVGVCGQFNDFDKRYGTNLNINDELKNIDNKEWLFFTNKETPEDKRYIGKSVIRLVHHVRDDSKIWAGANDLIIELIKNKEREENCSFIDYLAQAKWIHISSLKTFEQFEEIMLYVIQAKEKNRFLKISIDPGYKFIDAEKERLQRYLQIADYVFLNKDEFENLIINKDMAQNDKYIKLGAYFNNPENVNAKVFIVKHKNRHELIDFVNGIPYVYYHHKLFCFEIFNDTGAGDCFAGGFIAGVLSDKLIAQQPASISLGALASRIRMSTPNTEEVYENIEIAAKKFFAKKYINGRNSIKQKLVFLFKYNGKTVLTFILGAILSYVVNEICYLIF